MGKWQRRFWHKEDAPRHRVCIAIGKEDLAMKCEVCGNDYDKAFTVDMGGRQHVFDSFECAIHALAPNCAHCGCHVIGHGVEQDGTIFCCAYCAKQAGISGFKDRKHDGRGRARKDKEEADALVGEVSEE
jgi:nitrite reductase/ring-hydroxylating ferredoxin subunit